MVLEGVASPRTLFADPERTPESILIHMVNNVNGGVEN